MTAKLLVIHRCGDFLEHAALVATQEEAEELSCTIRPGDHWDMIVIPIEQAAAAPELLEMCEGLQVFLCNLAQYGWQPIPRDGTIETIEQNKPKILEGLEALIAKTKGE